MNIKKNDTVIVLSGKDKGKKGKVLVAMPKDSKVIVEGCERGHLPYQAPQAGRAGAAS